MESPELQDEARFERCDAAAFQAAVQRFLDIHPGTLALYSSDEYSKMLCVLNDAQTAGYALKDSDKLVSVFNMGAPGSGRKAVEDALRRGARRLDAFDGRLRSFYEQFGFTVKNIEKNLNEGGPDVIFMTLDDAKYQHYLSSSPS